MLYLVTYYCYSYYYCYNSIVLSLYILFTLNLVKFVKIFIFAAEFYYDE